ncbi:MAG TPA: T9SS type A sorting domain-containing protein [Flavisolibacter sp.]|nr:T9SS type A sorting domain-containing protein [Flavisolibacter sp.]
MKQIYSYLCSALLTTCVILTAPSVQGQSSTTVGTNGNCSNLVQNFNNNSGAHASPSIFGGTFDSAFYYNGTLGFWTEMDGGRTDFFTPNRTVTIISPPYTNPSPAGIFDVGFWYQTSNALVDKFQVRLVSVSPGPAGTTITNIVASSGARTFANFGTFTTKIDASNPANSGDTGRVCIRLLDPDITNGPNTFYRVEIAFIVNGTTYAAYDNLSIGPITSPAPLPVNFIGLVANKVNNSIVLRWDVADEIDVQEYQVEKSTNGRSFTTVGTVGANRKMVYKFTDANSNESQIFYRIKSVDVDGKVKYSGIIRLRNNDSFSDNLRLYPMPVHSQLTVQHSQLGANAKLSINTMDGRVLKVITPSAGVSNTMVDVSSLSSGMYILKVDHGNGKLETAKFVKQ